MLINQLDTEQHNPNSDNIENLPISEITAYINQEDKKVAEAVKDILPAVNQVVHLAVSCLNKGGRLVYIGAGTSGRLGVLDASECPPTFGVPVDKIQGVIAGGDKALRFAQEGAEDDREAAIADLKKIAFSSDDMLIGLAASGRTPYVMSALQYARSIGSKTAAISCVANSEISHEADVPIEILVGPEVVTGSSRMKAGTAQKMVLNMISTTTMIQLGKVYHGYMIDVQATNMKLVERAKHIIQKTTHCSYSEAEEVFEKSGRDVKIAILMQLKQLTVHEARQMLQETETISKAIKQLSIRED